MFTEIWVSQNLGRRLRRIKSVERVHHIVKEKNQDIPSFSEVIASMTEYFGRTMPSRLSRLTHYINASLPSVGTPEALKGKPRACTLEFATAKTNAGATWPPR